MANEPKILVIIGSTRLRRICPKIAAWVAEIGREVIPAPARLELVDLRDWPLPMDDEPDIPARGDYIFEHTKEWGRKVAEGDAYVFVSPQYNRGYPAPLKNAIDHLYKEWSGKPAMIVTYGSHGGDKCAAQLRMVFEGLKLRTVSTNPGLMLPRAHIEANAGEIDPATEFAGQAEAVRQAFGELAAELGGG